MLNFIVHNDVRILLKIEQNGMLAVVYFIHVIHAFCENNKTCFFRNNNFVTLRLFGELQLKELFEFLDGFVT